MVAQVAPATIPAGRRLRSPVLVGRDDELTRVVAAVSDPPAVVVVEGESGIGKTRLVSELMGHPKLAERRVMVGWCRPIREPFPLGPVLDMVRGLANELGTTRLSGLVGALRPLVPELADRLPPQPEPLDDRVAERHRVFRALVELVVSPGPVVLVLEDMHWADQQTIDFVSYLLADPPPGLSLVVTFRTEDVTAGFRAVPAKLPAAVTRIDAVLTPLDAAQTGVLAAAVLGLDRVPAGLRDELYARTSGSPFAIEELLILLRERGGPVPAGADPNRPALGEPGVPVGIRDPVVERASRLSALAGSVVGAAAVLQSPARVEVIAAMCRIPKSSAIPAIEEALAAGLLVEHNTGVGFRHLLAAQAMYEHLSRTRRQELHEYAAAALLAVDPAALGSAAYHLRSAGAVAKWVEAAELAGDRAVELGHEHEAVRQFDDLLRHAPLDPARRGRVAVKLARAALEALQDLDVAMLYRALAAAPQAEVRGELRFRIAVQLDRDQRGRARAREMCVEAIAELDTRPSLQAWAMACLGLPAGHGVPVSDHLRWVERALAVLPRIDPDLETGIPGLDVGVLSKAASALVGLGDGSWLRVHDRLVARMADPPRGRRDVYACVSTGLAACSAGHHRAAGKLLSWAVAGVRSCDNPPLERSLRAVRAVWEYHVENGTGWTRGWPTATMPAKSSGLTWRRRPAVWRLRAAVSTTLAACSTRQCCRWSRAPSCGQPRSRPRH